MEIKAELLKPYSEEQRMNFIVEYNHNLGYEIRETEEALQAWGYTEEEIAQQEAERIAQLHLTRGDVFRALLLARGVTRAQLRGMIELMPDETPEEQLVKEMALIDFDEALDFYRGIALLDTLGLALGITEEQMTQFFETNDYHYLIPDSRIQEEPEEEIEEGLEEVEQEETEQEQEQEEQQPEENEPLGEE